jgi:hypothetical protein
VRWRSSDAGRAGSDDEWTGDRQQGKDLVGLGRARELAGAVGGWAAR